MLSRKLQSINHQGKGYSNNNKSLRVKVVLDGRLCPMVQWLVTLWCLDLGYVHNFVQQYFLIF